LAQFFLNKLVGRSGYTGGMHWIQRHILVTLVRHSRGRYSQLRPDGVEGNLFLYHLDGLIKDKLVEKVGRDYQLTAGGLRFVASLSLKTEKTRQQPLVLTAVVCQNEAGEHLLSRWVRQPNAGLISLPHGMVHYGRTLHDMAATELAEKAGLTGQLHYRGVVNILAYLEHKEGQEPELDRNMLVHVFEATNVKPGRTDELRPDASSHFWANLKDHQPTEFVPGFYEIAQIAASTNSSIYTELQII
jgi:ADP-ribose pyrophosphatase YjhB (NUDIX family)